MNKKVLAVAVIAAMSASAAQADVKMFGALQAEVASLGGDSGTSGLLFGDTSYGKGNKGKFGAKWTDGDVFGNLSFNINLGGGVSPASVSKVRDIHLGMKVGPGKLQLGRHASLYKVTGGAKIDPFHATGLQARENGGSSAAQNGYISSARYSMKVGAIKVGVDYTPETVNSSNGETATGVAGTARVGIAASMDVGSITVFFATDDHNSNIKTPNVAASGSLTKFGAKMKMGKINLAAQIESGMNAAGVKTVSGTTDDSITFISATMPMGGMTLAGWLGIADVNGTSLAVGIKKSMSKKSSLYAGFRSTGFSKTKSATYIVAGLRTGF